MYLLERSRLPVLYTNSVNNKIRSAGGKNTHTHTHTHTRSKDVDFQLKDAYLFLQNITGVYVSTKLLTAIWIERRGKFDVIQRSPCNPILCMQNILTIPRTAFLYQLRVTRK
jgi:hypothetical protein